MKIPNHAHAPEHRCISQGRSEIQIGGIRSTPGNRLGRIVGRPKVRREPRGNMNADVAHQFPEIAGPSDRHANVADRVLDDQVPANNPGDQFAERCVGVRVGAARDGHDRGELRITQGGESTRHGRENEGQNDGRAGAWTHRVSSNRRARGDEHASPNGGADAQCREVPLAQRSAQTAAFGQIVFAVGNRLPTEEFALVVVAGKG